MDSDYAVVLEFVASIQIASATRLARIIHEHFAAHADLALSAALGLRRLLDVPSRYACAPEPAPAFFSALLNA